MVNIHTRFPLFASCSDDGNTHIFHQTVYSDLLMNALIVPVKVLKGHEPNKIGMGMISQQCVCARLMYDSSAHY
jgi:ribosome biogenesis protein ERB1